MKKYGHLAVPLLIAAACTGGDQRSPTAPDLGLTSARQTGPSISVTKLPSLGGGSIARAINDDQVIVGSSNGLPVKWTLDASGQWAIQALQSTAGAAEDITELGVIVGSSAGSVILWAPGAAPETIGIGIAAAINKSQVVVGRETSPTDGNGARAWTRSAMGTGWDVHVLPTTGYFAGGYSEPTGINDEGVIVGNAAPVGGSTHAVKWVPSLTTPGEWDAAVPLDDVAAAYAGGAGAIRGQDIVGTVLRCLSCTSGNVSRDPHHWSLTDGQGIGSLGSADAWAEGLNAQRSIVGSFFYGGVHAFVWTVLNPTIRDLGAPNGYQTASAYDINSPTSTRSTAQAVGEASSPSGKHSAVVWTIP
jgi:hypothetical protein